ncbi:MAG: cation:H+ antiporter [Solirubrobacteraceae bacterium]|nr:cation:H+ antiporter [Solirubrobacteraceae bacterium]
MSSLSVPLLVAIFAAAGAGVWAAGVQLSNTTDVLSSRLGLGEALGGLILLAIATNLPEIAITASAALQHNLGIAVGNILGGIAIQTVVLVVLDVVAHRGRPPLTYRAASLQLMLEGALVIAVLVLAIMGTQLPSSLIVGRVAPSGLLIAVAWVAGIWLLSQARTNMPWHEQGRAPDTSPRPQRPQRTKQSTARAAVVFAGAALVTLAGGVLLEESGSRIAGHLGMSGVLFGSTVLAAATALPELSTGLASIRLGDDHLAISDIFGGNAFLPVLFLLAGVLSGSAVLPDAKSTDIYLAGLGALLTVVYMWGLVMRPARRVLGMGLDSLVVLVLYLVGIGGLVAIAQG